ncbi:MAG: 30S ribosomal protein S13 [Nanoarchaeota archaeon]
MAETQTKEGKIAKEAKRPRGPKDEEQSVELIRLYSNDIPGNKNLYTGLTNIKGISWAIANAVCLKLGMDKNMKVSQLSKEQIEKIESLLQKPEFYHFLKNHRREYETGEARHLLTNELDITHEFDIKRMKHIKSYKGIRHALKQPVRGQRTRSHFRTTGIVVGVKKGKGKAK